MSVKVLVEVDVSGAEKVFGEVIYVVLSFPSTSSCNSVGKHIV